MIRGMLMVAVLLVACEDPPEPAKPPPTAEELKAASDRRVGSHARVAAEMAIEKILKSPSTARFGSKNVLAVKDDHALVSMDVDAQNGFGATLRQHYCVVVTVGAGDNVSIGESGIQECDDPPDQAFMLEMMLASDWPGLKSDISEATKAMKKRLAKKKAKIP